MNILKRRPQSTENENVSGSDKKRVIRRVALVMAALLAAFAILTGIFASDNLASENADPFTPGCEKAPEPYLNRGGFSAETLKGQPIFVVDGVFGDGSGSLDTGESYIPTCDEVDGERLKKIKNLLIEMPIVDEQGNIIGHELLYIHRAIVGGDIQLDPTKALTGEQQNQLQPTPTLQAYP